MPGLLQYGLGYGYFGGADDAYTCGLVEEFIMYEVYQTCFGSDHTHQSLSLIANLYLVVSVNRGTQRRSEYLETLSMGSPQKGKP